jgi:hypothetical protein
MMVIVMAMAMVMAMMLVMVPEALRQVGWLRQRQSCHRLRASYRPKLPQTQSFPLV